MNNNRRIGDAGEEGDQRRTSLEARMLAIEEKVDRLSGTDSKLEAKLDRNTELTQKVVEVMDTLSAGIKVLGVLGRVAKWATPFVTIGAAIWALMHGKAPSGE